eukprot:30633-Pelagococcus_subviridis.AAC.2
MSLTASTVLGSVARSGGSGHTDTPTDPPDTPLGTSKRHVDTVSTHGFGSASLGRAIVVAVEEEEKEEEEEGKGAVPCALRYASSKLSPDVVSSSYTRVDVGHLRTSSPCETSATLHASHAYAGRERTCAIPSAAPAIHAARRDVVVVASSSSPAPKPLGTTVAETRYERRSRRGDATRTTRRRCAMEECMTTSRGEVARGKSARRRARRASSSSSLEVQGSSRHFAQLVVAPRPANPGTVGLRVRPAVPRVDGSFAADAYARTFATTRSARASRSSSSSSPPSGRAFTGEPVDKSARSDRAASIVRFASISNAVAERGALAGSFDAAAAAVAVAVAGRRVAGGSTRRRSASASPPPRRRASCSRCLCRDATAIATDFFVGRTVHGYRTASAASAAAAAAAFVASSPSLRLDDAPGSVRPFGPGVHRRQLELKGVEGGD